MVAGHDRSQRWAACQVGSEINNTPLHTFITRTYATHVFEAKGEQASAFGPKSDFRLGRWINDNVPRAAVLSKPGCV